MRVEPLAAEFALASACCRSRGPERDAAVRAAASGVDWAAFRRTVRRHRIEGLAHAALVESGVAPDPATAEALRSDAAAVARKGLRLAAETARLHQLLQDAGIENLVLKGVTLDILAWGSLGAKTSWDIDLLVAVEEVARAREIVERAGYRLERPAERAAGDFERWVTLSKEAVFVDSATGLVVELHWRATDVATLLPDLSVRSPSQVVPLSAGVGLRTFAEEELFAYLCVHGTSHAWWRLKWLADVGGFLARCGEPARDRLYRRAVAMGAGHCAAAALLLCEQLLGLRLPPRSGAEIRADRKAARLVDVALDALSGAGGAELADRWLGPERVLLSYFLFADGWRFRLAEWKRQWVSVDDHMRLRLPRRLTFLYGLLRAPLWILRRLPPFKAHRPSRAPPAVGT